MYILYQDTVFIDKWVHGYTVLVVDENDMDRPIVFTENGLCGIWMSG